jgi:hypothetical protein
MKRAKMLGLRVGAGRKGIKRQWLCAGALLAMLVVVVMAGCGSSGEATGEDAQASIPKAEYVKRVEKICHDKEEQKYERIAAAFKLSGANAAELKKSDLEDITTKVVVPTIRELTEELEALPPAAKGQAKYDRVVKNLAKEVEEVEANPALFVESKAFTKSNEEATAIGIVECSLNQ